jgi:phospholipase C
MGPRDAAPQMRGAEGRITNVFVLMLENHSFDHVFAMSGIPGITVADLSDQNTYTPSGSTAPTTCHVRDGAPSSMSTDPAHEFPDVLRQLCNVATCGSDDDGADCYRGGAYPPVNLSGFAASYATSRSEGTGIPAPDRVGDIMACFHTETQLPVIYQLARQYAICDGWFASMASRTPTARSSTRCRAPATSTAFTRTRTTSSATGRRTGRKEDGSPRSRP